MLASSMHQQQMHKPLWHSPPHSQTVGAPSAPINTEKAGAAVVVLASQKKLNFE